MPQDAASVTGTRLDTRRSSVTGSLIGTENRRCATTAGGFGAKGARELASIAHGGQTRLVDLEVVDVGEHSGEFQVLIIQPAFPEVQEVRSGDERTVLAQLDTTKQLGETSELFGVRYERVRAVGLNQLLEGFAMTLRPVLTRRASKLHADRVPQCFAVVRTLPTLQNHRTATATFQCVRKVTEGSDADLQLQRRVNGGGETVVVYTGPTVVRCAEQNECVTPG
jgi:hypothetical protein